ncbi:MAG: YeeE/YedE family protein [Bdellovibrionaceae bacterium]|jgi:uncharacterized membrane protein YedE/YeeE|nr:YeeE/YedE family protein [Pseudobdellovibrionaceae bacterium]
MTQTIINALFGGLLIGVAVSLMLLFNGRVTGISGIVNGIITPQKGDTVWRIFFVLGLLLGGLILKILMPGSLLNTLPTSNGVIFLAGLLVGFGTIMGSGCTSGHGICGFSRLSPRSFIATVVFISAGIFAVYFFKKFGG